MTPIALLRTQPDSSTPVARHAAEEKPLPLLMQIVSWMDMQSPTLACVLGGLLIVSIGILSYLTGPQFTCSLLYLIPILLITRVVGFRQGFFAAVIAGLIWLAADLYAEFSTSESLFDNPFTPYWNVVMRLGTFLVAVSLVSAMRSLNTDLEERVRERTADLEAKVAEKRELEKNILEISDREQVRIGQDLHDGLCQQLVSAAFSANLLQEKLARDSTAGARDANLIAEMIDDAITQARNLARGLYPTRLETEGLEMALRELASTMSRRFNVSCSVECQAPIARCKPSAGIHLYRIAQEAVTNAAKHARSQHIVISLVAAAGRVKMIIEDDGIGIANVPLNPAGMGLRIMEYRARMIGATFMIHNLPQRGTTITCKLDEKSFQS